MAKTLTPAAEAVERYLRFIDPTDPFSADDAVDEEHIAELRAKIEASDDQLEKLELNDQLTRALDPHDFLEAEFAKHAGQYARKHGLSAQSFKNMGVSDATLRRAGMKPPTRWDTTFSRPKNSSSRVTRRDVQRAMVAYDGAFTTDNLVKVSQASIGTVRATIKDALADGLIKEAGKIEGVPHVAPMSYAVTAAGRKKL